MKNNLKKLLIVIMAVSLTLSVPISAAVKDKDYYDNNITIYNGTTWTYTLASDATWIGTVNGNKTDNNGSKYKKDYCTVTKSGKTLKIVATGSKKFNGSSQTQVVYLYKGKTEGSKANLVRKITVKIRSGSKPAITQVSHNKNSSSKDQVSGITCGAVIYTNDKTTVTATTSGSYDKFSWCFYDYDKKKDVTSINGAKLSSTSSKSTTVTGVSTGTYTLQAKVESTYTDNGKVGTTNHVIYKVIKIYVKAKPEIDVMANSISVSSITMATDDEIEISQKLANVGSNVDCSIEASVDDNSTNYIDLKKQSSTGIYLLTAKNGFKEGTTATFTYTLTIKSGDSVSDASINNGKVQGTQIIKKTISVKIGKSSFGSYIVLKNNDKTLGDNIYLTDDLDFKAQCSGVKTFDFDIENPNVISIEDFEDNNFQFVQGNIKGMTVLTVTGKTTSGVTRTRKYNVYNCDNVYSSLSAKNIGMLANEKTQTVFYGISTDNADSGLKTKLVLAQDKITYDVDNPRIATISEDGTVKSLSVGSTKVTVALNQSSDENDDDGYYEDFSDGYYDDDYSDYDDSYYDDYDDDSLSNFTTTFIINVYEPISQIKFNESKKIVNIGKKVKQNPVNYPRDAFTNTTYTWTSSNPSVATVDENGYVTGKRAGSVKITAIATDGTGKNSSYTVNVLSKAPTSVKGAIGVGKITISWKGVSGSSKYEVYRSEGVNMEYKRVGTTSGTNYSDKSAKYGSTYYYKVKAIPTVGSSYTSDYSVRSKGYKFIPTTPKISSVRKSSGAYRVSISGNKYDGFVIYVGRKKATKKAVSTITSKSGMVYLKKKRTSYIRVRAYVNQSGKTIYSNYSRSYKKKVK